jgi:hypothetical protein
VAVAGVTAALRKLAAPELPELAGAACAGTADPELWFDPWRVEEAKAACGRCPAQAGCLTYALERRIRFGVWGGQDMESRPERGRVLSMAVVLECRARCADGETAAALARELGVSQNAVQMAVSRRTWAWVP